MPDDREDAPRALVADELPLVRLGLVALLSPLGLDVVAETHSGREAASIAALEHPDLVVVGAVCDLPVLDTCRRVLRLRPAPAIVALVAHAADPVARLLVGYGVAGVALRPGPPADLAAVVEAVMGGGRRTVDGLDLTPGGWLDLEREEAADAATLALTAREREVLGFLAQGLTNREIAATLSVAPATVRSHLVHLYSKLGVSDRREALGRAAALGVLG